MNTDNQSNQIHLARDESQIKDHGRAAKTLCKVKVARALKQVLSNTEFLKTMIGRKRQFTGSLFFMNPKKNPLRIQKSCGE